MDRHVAVAKTVLAERHAGKKQSSKHSAIRLRAKFDGNWSNF